MLYGRSQMISCPFRLHNSESVNISLEFPLLKDFCVRVDHYLLKDPDLYCFTGLLLVVFCV